MIGVIVLLGQLWLLAWFGSFGIIRVIIISRGLEQLLVPLGIIGGIRAAREIETLRVIGDIWGN